MMCKVCGCTACRCGRKIINKVCAGCGQSYNNCTCEKISKKNGSSYDKTRENLLSQGKKLMNGK